MYDNICKSLAESSSTDFATWLLGKPIPLTKLVGDQDRIDTPRAKARGFLIQRDNLPDRLTSTWQRSDSSKGVEISVCPTVFFNPIASIFSAAFKSLSNPQPHLQIWVRVLNVFLTNVPQVEQF